MSARPTKREVRRALAVALARSHEDVVTRRLNLNELAVLVLERGLPASPDLLNGKAET